MLNVVMISTGEEVLYGDITDTNAAWLSAQFFEQGFAMTRRVTVGDDYEALAKEIEMCSLSADIVIVNGGLVQHQTILQRHLLQWLLMLVLSNRMLGLLR